MLLLRGLLKDFIDDPFEPFAERRLFVCDDRGKRSVGKKFPEYQLCMIAANWINRLFTNRGEKALRDKIRNAWKKVGYYGPLGKELGKLVEQVLAEQPKKVEEDEEED